MATDPQSFEQAPISFTAALSTVDDVTLARLPEDVSERLGSRGQVAAHASIGGRDFETVLEPDGRRGHWIRVDEVLQWVAGVSGGGNATASLQPRQWAEGEATHSVALHVRPRGVALLYSRQGRHRHQVIGTPPRQGDRSAAR